MSEENENNVAGDQWPPESTQSPIIVPTIGRIVHFYENYQHGDNDPLAAIITDISHDRLVNLAVFSKFGGNFGSVNVHLIQPGDDMPNPGGGVYATWMPYQIGQAAKTEELAGALADIEGSISNPPKEETLEDVISEALDDEPGIESGAPSGTYDGVKITPSAEEIRDGLDGEVIPGHQNGVSD